jgi:ketosteroid isomerase-like protein
MRQTFAIVLFALLAGQQPDAQIAGTVEQELIKLEQTLGDAMIRKDKAILERVYATEYVYTHSNGAVLNKAQEIADTMSSNSKWTSSTFADLKVRVYGDVAIVTGVQTLLGTSQGYMSGARRITDLFIKRDGRWQQIGGQTTLVPAK